MKINNTKIKSSKLKILEEGKVKFFLFNKDIDSIPTKSMDVFYNKKMEINRDITNLAVDAYCELYDENDLTLVDSMAGSGIGSIRLLKESKNIKKIYINDINPVAEELIIKNLDLNNLLKVKTEIIVSRKDANFLFSEITENYLTNIPSNQEKPHIISIDPFGTPNLYTDGAFKAIKKQNGLLCITATDTAVLFGVKPNACRRKYMAKPLHNEFCKETGARILLYFISRIANINGLGIKPLLTFYHSHFIRIFVTTISSKKTIAKQLDNYGYIIYCNECGNRFILKDNPIHDRVKCGLCGEKSDLDYAGPIWAENIHDYDFLSKIEALNKKSKIKNRNKLNRILEFCKEEYEMPISYYDIHRLCKQIKSSHVPTMELLLKDLHNNNYKASRTHFSFTSIKTDANINSIKKIILNLDN